MGAVSVLHTCLIGISVLLTLQCVSSGQQCMGYFGALAPGFLLVSRRCSGKQRTSTRWLLLLEPASALRMIPN